MAKFKFFQKKVTVDGIRFDSKTEAEEYKKLRELEKSGKIRNLQRQVSFEIIPPLRKLVKRQLKTKVKWVEVTEEHAAKYTCDFQYEKDGQIVVLEVKSRMTAKLADYVLRRKLMKRILHDRNELLGEERYVFKEIIAK